MIDEDWLDWCTVVVVIWSIVIRMLYDARCVGRL